MKPEVSVLMVGYNSERYLPDCLRSVADAAKCHSMELLFIDNSEGPSSDLVPRLHTGAHVLPSRGNIGFAAAVNLLAEHASADWLLLLNPDTVLEPGAIDALLGAAKVASEYGVLGGTTITDRATGTALPQLELPDQRTILASMLGLSRREAMPPDGGLVQTVNATSGGFMLVRLALWQALGGLDERFFLYGEDLDLCRRAQTAGWAIGHVPEARIFHDVGGGEVHSPSRLRYRALGTATYHHKHFKPLRAWCHVLMMWAAFSVRALGFGSLLLFSQRYCARFRAIAPLVFQPWKWIRGYRPSESATSE